MLPGRLTTELCSLRSKRGPLGFLGAGEMDEEGNIHDVRFAKSVIHSVASLTYDQAQVMLDDPNIPDIRSAACPKVGSGRDEEEIDFTIGTSVKLLNHFARKLRKRRIDMGALTLASPEVRFKFERDSESGDSNSNPTDVSQYQLKEANALVEEWMLLANITVSKKILRHFPLL